MNIIPKFCKIVFIDDNLTTALIEWFVTLRNSKGTGSNSSGSRCMISTNIYSWVIGDYVQTTAWQVSTNCQIFPIIFVLYSKVNKNDNVLVKFDSLYSWLYLGRFLSQFTYPWRTSTYILDIPQRHPRFTKMTAMRITAVVVSPLPSDCNPGVSDVNPFVAFNDIYPYDILFFLSRTPHEKILIIQVLRLLTWTK
jgi:hypothetical protein